MDKQIKTSRRNFLLGAGAGISLHYSNAVITQDNNIAYRSWEDVARKKWTWDSVTHSTHGTNCTGQCAFNVFVKNGVVWERRTTR